VRFGSFTVGGRRLDVSGEPTRTVRLSADLPDYPVDPNGTYAEGHAYVQFFEPDPALGVPLVLVHGGGMTGACWETTPDGRDGWVQRLVAAGRPAYVVDNVERGRAGWCAAPGRWDAGATLLRTEQEAWDAFRIGPLSTYATRSPYAGATFPVAHLDALNRQQVPRWTTSTEDGVAAVVALVERIGPCVLVGHSQGGGIVAHAATRVPVEAVVLLEPHGLPDVPAPVPQLLLAGDFLDETPLYRGLRTRWLEYAAAPDVTYLDLPAAGLPGNSHLLMMDTTSDAVLERVLAWLRR
jgi:pimeloyl-ACP methyl ester carboxylesterase